MTTNNLSAALQLAIENNRSNRALIHETGEWTYGDLDGAGAAVSRQLTARGVHTGDRVAVGLANSAALVATVVGVLRHGAILVPLNPNGSADEAAFAVANSQASLAIVGEDQRAWGDLGAPMHQLDDLDLAQDGAWHECDDRDTALLVYTSGTTGRPKGVMLSHSALGGNLATVRSAWQWTGSDRLLLTLPCFHLHGLALGILGSLSAGASFVLRPRFVAEDVPGLLAEHRCTLFFGVPTMYNRLVQLEPQLLQRSELGAMRLWVSGSAPLTGATFEQFRDLFGHDILERFGMSEGGFMIAAPLDETRRPGVIGYPLPGIDIRLIDPELADQGELRDVEPAAQGEIAIRGPNLFSGYWNDEDATRRAYVQDFFRSGDLAVREADGMIRIVGRISVDIIKCRGFKVSAVEIESVLQKHPAVAEVAVVGIPHPDLGQEIVAVVSPSAQTEMVEDDLLSYAREHLAGYKIPSRFVRMETIPRTGPGKFKKKALIDQLG